MEKKVGFPALEKYIVRNCAGGSMAWIKCINGITDGGDEWINSEKIVSIYYNLRDKDQTIKEVIVKVKPDDFLIFQKRLEVDILLVLDSDKSDIERSFREKAEDIIKEIIEKISSVDNNQMIDLITTFKEMH